MNGVIAQLHKAAEKAGPRVEQRSLHHFQILGGHHLVDYYPTSRKRTAYVDGTNGGRTNVTPEAAVQMALKPPPVLPQELRSPRKAPKASRRRRLFRSQPNCHWCGQPMQIPNPDADDYGTIEHVIPLARGGMDHGKNRVLAHKKCNNARGHDMPELSEPSSAGEMR